MQDYYNLVDVYLDAVLQPRCVTDPKTFAQEGWHYELDDAQVSPRVCRCSAELFNQHSSKYASGCSSRLVLCPVVHMHRMLHSYSYTWERNKSSMQSSTCCSLVLW